MKYVATNDTVYIQARSLNRLSKKVEKYLVKLAEENLKKELELSLLDEWNDSFQAVYIGNQVNITRLGFQDITVKGLYKNYSEVDMWNITKTFKVFKRW